MEWSMLKVRRRYVYLFCTVSAQHAASRSPEKVARQISPYATEACIHGLRTIRQDMARYCWKCSNVGRSLLSAPDLHFKTL